MNAPTIHIEQALNEPQAIWLDARSEGEYAHAHIPGAISLPLLNNEDRHAIGMVYKQQGKQAAVMLGFERVGPRFHQIIQEGLRICDGREVMVYCWRGGMRSNILGWLLQTAGLRVRVVEGGYKSFRHAAIDAFQRPQKMKIL
ncbi:MAG: rhodanese-like domain-containing protein, partial [Flavobacteriales bacterium]